MNFSHMSADEFGRLKPRVAQDVLVHQYEDGMIAWSPRSRQFIALEGVTELLFQILDGSGTVDEVASDVQDVVGVPKTVALGKLRQTLEVFGTAGLLDGDPVPGRSAGTTTKLDLFPAPPNP